MLPPPPSTPHNNIMFELDFNVKFPLLRLLQILSDLKSTVSDEEICLNKCNCALTSYLTG